MRVCTKCVLPETFPGIRFDEAGVCNYCHMALSPERVAQQRAKTKAEFESFVAEIRGRATYDCVMSWSGGKDSTYTMAKLVQEYGLKVLAFTFDNGFVSEKAFPNMRRVAERLGVDRVILSPSDSLLRKVFVGSMAEGIYPPKALTRASAICSSCMGLAKGAGLRLAVEKGIPLVAFGWSPGQIPISSAFFKQPRLMARAMNEASLKPLLTIAGDAVRPFFLEDSHFVEDRMPRMASPLAWLEYDEGHILKTIRDLGWERPTDTDPNSTNCLLNALGNAIHQKHFHYHPYIGEMAGLVREGRLDREEALAKVAVPESPDVLRKVAASLGIPDYEIKQGA